MTLASFLCDVAFKSRPVERRFHGIGEGFPFRYRQEPADNPSGAAMFNAQRRIRPEGLIQFDAGTNVTSAATETGLTLTAGDVTVSLIGVAKIEDVNILFA